MPTKKPLLSKREFVYETLRSEILTGERAPGERLVIDDLADDLGVSPIPVREALQQLKFDGLVTIKPYAGVHVTSVDAGVIREIFALLEAFEVFSSQRACLRMGAEDFAAMAELLTEMDGQVDDLEAWSAANVKLHQLICRHADVALIPAMIQQVLDQWQRLRRLYLDDVFAARVSAAQREHWQMFEALRTRDPAHVAAVIHDHNRQALAAYIKCLTQNGQLA